MSRSTPAHPRLDPALISHLVDDAAVFPPGSSPLDVAVADHLARRTTPLARWTGPLLVPAADAAQVPQLAGGRPLRVGLVARPGTPASVLSEGAAALTGTPVEVASVELGWAPGWRAAAQLAPTVVVEMPREEQERALDDIAEGTKGGAEVLAKWRTGATPTWSWPDEAETAAVLAALVARGLPFKLTGGLHHLVRGERGDVERPDPQHGLLDVLVAVERAVAGAPVDELTATLRRTDGPALGAHLAGLGQESVRKIRDTFRSYGCCTVTDPLGELAELDLMPHEGDQS